MKKLRIHKAFSKADLILLVVGYLVGSYTGSAVQEREIYMRVGYVYEQQSPFLFWSIIAVFISVTSVCALSVVLYDFKKDSFIWEKK